MFTVDDTPEIGAFSTTSPNDNDDIVCFGTVSNLPAIILGDAARLI